MEIKRKIFTVLLTMALVLSFPMALMAGTEDGNPDGQGGPETTQGAGDENNDGGQNSGGDQNVGGENTSGGDQTITDENEDGIDDADNEFKVVYDLNGGNATDATEPTEYTGLKVGQDTPKIADPEREHYDFDGWDPDVNDTIAAADAANSQDKLTITYTAKWAESPNKVYYDFINDHCKVQTPEAGDDYVSVFVDMPAAGSQDITGELLAKRERFMITVFPDADTTNGNNSFVADYHINESDNGGEQFVFTATGMQALSENKTIAVRCQFFDENGIEIAASDIHVDPVKKAFTNKAFAPRALKIKVTPKKKEYTYSGNYIKPAVTITATYNGKKVPAGTLSYTTAYAGCRNVGTARVKVTMTGDYTGSASATYKINPKGTSISKLTAAKKGFTVNWKAQKTKMKTFWITGYQVQYSTNSKFKSGNKMVTVGKKEKKDYKLTSKKITKLNAKKKYYVRVRTYKKLSGKYYYSTWSKAKAVTTK